MGGEGGGRRICIKGNSIVLANISLGGVYT